MKSYFNTEAVLLSFASVLLSCDPPARFPAPPGLPLILEKLQRVAKEELNEETRELLYPYLADEDLTVENAGKVSANLTRLCAWVRSLAPNIEVIQVAPKVAAEDKGKRRKAR